MKCLFVFVLRTTLKIYEIFSAFNIVRGNVPRRDAEKMISGVPERILTRKF